MYSTAVLNYNQVIPVHHHPCCTKNHLPDQSQVGRLPVQREDDDQLLPPDSSFGLVYTASSCIQQVAPSAGIPAKSMRNLSGCLHATAGQRLS